MPFNASHYITFHTNNFLASPEGQSIVNRVFSNDDSGIKDALTKRVDVHNQIMDNMNNSQEVPQQVAQAGQPLPQDPTNNYDPSMTNPPSINKNVYDSMVRQLDQGKDDYSQNQLSPQLGNVMRQA